MAHQPHQPRSNGSSPSTRSCPACGKIRRPANGQTSRGRNGARAVERRHGWFRHPRRKLHAKLPVVLWYLGGPEGLIRVMARGSSWIYPADAQLLYVLQDICNDANRTE